MLLLVLVMGIVSVVGVAEEKPFIGSGDYNDEVMRLHQKLTDLGYYHLRVESPFGPNSISALNTLQDNMGWEITDAISSRDQLEQIIAVENVTGKNLAGNSSSEWSNWMTPDVNAQNKTFNVGYAYLQDRRVGDYYACSIEIEFADVTATVGGEDEKFGFWTQGTVDGSWDIGNVWDSKIIRLTEVPENGVYKYTAISRITEKNVNAVQFNLGFRCDYWASGSFRVRNIKVEKGSVATDWVPCEYDAGDGKNIAANTSSEWSDWLTPETNAQNRCFTVAIAYPGERHIGDAYTCQLESNYPLRCMDCCRCGRRTRESAKGSCNQCCRHS